MCWSNVLKKDESHSPCSIFFHNEARLSIILVTSFCYKKITEQPTAIRNLVREVSNVPCCSHSAVTNLWSCYRYNLWCYYIMNMWIMKKLITSNLLVYAVGPIQRIVPWQRYPRTCLVVHLQVFRCARSCTDNRPTQHNLLYKQKKKTKNIHSIMILSTTDDLIIYAGVFFYNR